MDRIPFVPRIDLWHNANELAGTLPGKYRGMTVEEIHRAEGWPLHKIVPEYLKPERPEDIHHRAMGLYRLKEFSYDFEFASDVDIVVRDEISADEVMTHVEYHTPKGTISVRHGYTTEMKAAGASITWVKEHAIKGREDYAACAHIFGNLRLKPAYERFENWKASVGEDGVAHGQGLGIGCSSPMHFIQKTLLGSTDFYIHYHDFEREMRMLAEALEEPYNQVIRILAGSPCDAVLWSANVDDMITYPELYEKEFMPWIRKAHDAFAPRGILVVQHPDGENKGLMDLIARSGVDVADAVTPYPMTKVTIDEYYDRWCRSGKLTIHGGIPEMLLVEESSTREDLKAFLDHLFNVIAPGTRFIASIGDTSPPNTDFDRLRYIEERFQKEGLLPLAGGGADAISKERMEQAAARLTPSEDSGRLPAESPDLAAETAAGMPELEEDPFALIRSEVLEGDHERLKSDVRDMLDRGYAARDILNQGMLSAMEVLGEKFTDGTVFIPEVLLAARALNEALTVLEPHLAGDVVETPTKILIGTVRGDLHDIGKNMVVTMLKGVGMDVVDLGINVKVDDFVKKVVEEKPDILGLSALLTTTMPQIRSVINALTEAGLREQIKVMIGGAPVNQKFADDVGADGYAHDAGAAVTLAKRLIAGK